MYDCAKNNYPYVYKAKISGNHISSVLTRITERVSEFLDCTILELEYGAIPEEIFNNIRREVDSKMVSICPDAINKLEVSYENIVTGSNPESWSHVASTCGQIIEDVADVLFPAQSKPIVTNGKMHPVKHDNYINRIIAAIQIQNKSETENNLSRSMFEYTGAFLRNIQTYASKGDHSKFTKADATRCLVYTYLLLGDIMNYYTHKET